MRKYLAVLILITGLHSSQAFAQKQTSSTGQTWVAYFNQMRFSDRWGTWVDLHLRTKEDVLSDLSTGILRVGITYYAGDRLRFTGGYAYVNHFPAAGHENVSQYEHRPWQQVQWQTQSPKYIFSQWVRLEERFRRKILNNDELGQGYQFNWRLRYNLLLQLPLSERAFAPRTFSFVANDEVHINFGKEIVYNYFDQNRFFIGLAYHINKSNAIQFGYLNVFQQLAAGNRYRTIHAPRIYYLHNLDLRKKNGIEN